MWQITSFSQETNFFILKTPLAINKEYQLTILKSHTILGTYSLRMMMMSLGSKNVIRLPLNDEDTKTGGKRWLCVPFRLEAVHLDVLENDWETFIRSDVQICIGAFV